ncbi:hypothetical protein P170DRAFT_447018 [Aspergillus steynii IBT 23096]|uniref:N-acetyltransferase domain-containing protein n=1 Tax=Aspergillus steynii IBT 23096 TaxID=1392250 RepID=A0A2I2G8Y6_9EURO|nr:uncharacterized protein P170DRAFT_447018 [Aspergillus steynii IBT 23096]PLB49345.1 hypothetical protein P170DRAFT_447018 [Aspergillus steynii IBT 23096]
MIIDGESIHPAQNTCHQPKYEIHNAKDRPDLWGTIEHPDHPLNTVWPVFIDQDETFTTYNPQLTQHEELARYQFMITETALDNSVSVVAYGQSVPFFWPEVKQADDNQPDREHPVGYNCHSILETLPDGGFDTILSRGVRQYLTRHGLPGGSVSLTKDQKRDTPVCRRADDPNALSAIAIAVVPSRRRKGLAEALLETMKATARQENLRLLVAPLRPTRKADHPLVPMEEYIKWPNQVKSSASSPHHVPFDPWLRKHLRFGGKIVKVAPRSMTVQGSREDWRQWTGVDFSTRRGVYVEPNVWIFHDLNS